MVKNQMDKPKSDCSLLRLHGVSLDLRQGVYTVVAQSGVKHMNQNGCLFALVRRDTNWLWVPSVYVDPVCDSLEHEGEHILLL